MNNRANALVKYLDENHRDYSDISKSDNNENAFVLDEGLEEYLVLTDKEANDKAREFILQELWAFNPDFLLRHNKNFENMDNWEYDAAIQSLKKAQAEQAECLNGLARCLISDIDEFVEDAINEDGRGHFIASYDCSEEEVEYKGTTYYIYRIN